MLPYKLLRSNQQNLIVFSLRKHSYIPMRAPLNAKPLKNIHDKDKQILQNVDQRILVRPETSNRHSVDQQISLNSPKSRNVCVMKINNDRNLCLSISNNLREPLLSIDDEYSNPPISNGLHQAELRNNYIQMPLKQARLLAQRIYKLSALNFKVDKSVASLCMDRWTETPLECGLIQQLYTHRLPGMLYSEKQSAYYLSVLRFKALRYSGETQNKISEAARFEQQATKQPLIYISQHTIKRNEYHLWDPFVFTIEVPIEKVFELACQIDTLLLNSAKAIKQMADDLAQEKLSPSKPHFDLNNKDPISYFATPISTPNLVKKINYNQRTGERYLENSLSSDKLGMSSENYFPQHKTGDKYQHVQIKQGVHANVELENKSNRAKMFLEKLNEASSILDVMNKRGGRSR